MCRSSLAENEKEVTGRYRDIVEAEFQARNMAQVVEDNFATLRGKKEELAIRLNELEESGSGREVEYELKDLGREGGEPRL